MQDFTVAGFLEKLTEVTVAVREAGHSGLEAAAQLVEATAKDNLGTYQPAAGPFAAWGELADSTKDQRVKQGYTENDPGLRNGDMRDSVEHTVIMDGFDGEAHIGSDQEKMVYFELGTSKQPPRSDLGSALVQKTDEVREILGGIIFGALIGKDVHQGGIPLINE